MVKMGFPQEIIINAINRSPDPPVELALIIGKFTRNHRQKRSRN